ncbi:MAG: prolyl oligopeptidase family serine peptidase [Gammaproteobacteria bacterium]|nr:prolyl oligopeptidase family serine peptidase [Gammaproteobacteria bacterium]MCL5255721.1 prolyl oligopeptidase family serine peptidase [Gammaproteobacteria bacterium]
MQHLLTELRRRWLPVVMIVALLPIGMYASETVAQARSTNAQPRPLELTDIMQFREIQQQVTTDDLAVIAFSANPDYGDREGQVVRSGDGTIFTVVRGMRPQVTSDGRFAVFLQQPPLLERERATSREERRKLVQNAVLVNVESGEQEVFSHAQSTGFANDGQVLYVVHNDTYAKENGSEHGSLLRLIDLNSGEQTLIHNLVDVVAADEGSRLALHVVREIANGDTNSDESNNDADATTDKNSKAQTEHAVVLYNLANHSGSTLLQTAKKVVSKLTFAPNGEALAFLVADLDSNLQETPQALWLWQAGQGVAEVNTNRRGMILSEHSPVRWSDDNARLFIGHRPTPAEKVPSRPQPESMADLYDLDRLLDDRRLQVWHGDDGMIMPQQRQTHNQRQRATATSVLHIAEQTLVALSDSVHENVMISDNPVGVMVSNQEPHLRDRTWDGFYHDLYYVDLSSGERQQIAERLTSSQRGLMAPNGQYVVFMANSQIQLFDAASGQIQTLATDVPVSWVDEENDRPADPSPYGFAGWLADSSAFWIYDRFDIWQVTVANEATNLTRIGREQNQQFRIAMFGEQRSIDATQPVLVRMYHEQLKHSGFYQLDVQTSQLNQGQQALLVPLIEDQKTYTLVAHSDDHQRILFTEQDFRQFPDLWLAPRDFSSRQRLTDVNPQRDAFVWGHAELVEWESTRGEPLQGVLIKPDNYDPNKRYPVMVYFYEKFSQRLYQWNQMRVNHRPNFPFYLGQDYVVFLPDVHFRIGAPGPSATESLVPAIEKIIELGVADPNAIGLHGHSWSGYQAAFLVAETDIFTAVVSGAPVSNMTSAYSGIRWGTGLARQFQYETGQSRIGESMFDNLEPYLLNSPVFVADRINTPMLIQFGDKDEAVPWEQGIEYYLALRRLDKPVVMLQYEGEPHHLQRFANKIDYSIKMLEFFDHFLKGAPAPSWWQEGLEYQHYE